MSARGNWILLGIAILLTAYALVFEAGSPVWTQRGRLYPDLDPNEIVELRLERPGFARDAALGIDARPIQLRKEGSPPEWWIVDPIHFEAFHPRVQTLAFDIAELMRIADVASGEVADPFEKGVDLALSFKTRDGQSFGLELGAEHPDSRLDLVYARETKPGASPFVIRKEFRRSLLVSLTDLRSRALLGIAPPDSVRLEVLGEARFAKVVVRDGLSDRWRLKEPLDASADRQLVEELLRELNSWTVGTFHLDAAMDADLEACGLKTPRVQVRIQRKDRFGVALEIGGTAATSADGKEIEVFARHPLSSFIFKASAAPLTMLLKSHEELRSRYVFDFGLEDVEEISYESLAIHSTLKRIKEKGGRGDSWQVLDREGSVLFPGDKLEIDAAVSWHRSLTIQQFLAQGLERPTRKLVFRTSGKRTLELRLGDVSLLPEHRGLNLYPALVEGEPGSYLVSTDLPMKFEAGAHSFRQKNLSTLDPARVREMRIVEGVSDWSLAQVQPGEPWMLDLKTPVAEGKELNSALVNRLLSQLHRENFRVKRYEPGITDFVGNDLELQTPKRALILERVEGDDPVSFRKLVLGAPAGPPGDTLGRVETVGLPPFVIETDAVEAFTALVAHLHEVTGK